MVRRSLTKHKTKGFLFRKHNCFFQIHLSSVGGFFMKFRNFHNVLRTSTYSITNFKESWLRVFPRNFTTLFSQSRILLTSKSSISESETFQLLIETKLTIRVLRCPISVIRNFPRLSFFLCKIIDDFRHSNIWIQLKYCLNQHFLVG